MKEENLALKKFDVIAFLISTAISLVIAVFIAWKYKLGWHELITSSFFGLPIYTYMFFIAIDFPLYFWIRYFRANPKH